MGYLANMFFGYNSPGLESPQQWSLQSHVKIRCKLAPGNKWLFVKTLAMFCELLMSGVVGLREGGEAAERAGTGVTRVARSGFP